MHVARLHKPDANLEVNRPQSGALLPASCCTDTWLTDRRRTRHIFTVVYFNLRARGRNPKPGPATRRLDRLDDQLPEMIRLWPGIFLTALQTLFSSHISLRESFNKSILRWKWFLQLFIIVLAVEGSVNWWYGHCDDNGTKPEKHLNCKLDERAISSFLLR